MNQGMTSNAPQKAKESELKELIYALQAERQRQYDLVDSLRSAGHRLNNTNFPSPSPEQNKKESIYGEGILLDFKSEVDYLRNINDEFSIVVDKINSII